MLFSTALVFEWNCTIASIVLPQTGVTPKQELPLFENYNTSTMTDLTLVHVSGTLIKVREWSETSDITEHTSRAELYM